MRVSRLELRVKTRPNYLLRHYVTALNQNKGKNNGRCQQISAENKNKYFISLSRHQICAPDQIKIINFCIFPSFSGYSVNHNARLFDYFKRSLDFW